MTPSIRSRALAATLLATAACGTIDPTSPERGPDASASAAARVEVCHQPAATPQLIAVAATAVAAHLEHGDYVARLRVDPTATPGDGLQFRRLGDAVAAARAVREGRQERTAAACRITIDVASGTYPAVYGPSGDPGVESLPVVVDVPEITVRGTYRPALDQDERATDKGQTGDASIIAPTTPLTTSSAQFSQPILVVNGRSDGFGGHGALIEGLVFRSGNTGTAAGGLAILGLRVEDLTIRYNRFEAGFSESVDLRASRGGVSWNHFSGGGGTCDVCFAGPGTFHAEGNRILAGGIPGVLMVPAVLLPVPAGIEQYTLPASARMEATLVNNEVRNHQRVPVGTGLRVGAVGIGAPNVAGSARLEARNNTLVNNRFGMLIEAAFPVANTLRRGDIELELSGNTFASSCQSHLLVSFSRHTTALGLSNLPYLLGSTYSLDLGSDLAWSQVWYSHPAGFGNTLVVNGAAIPNGAYQQYDPAKVCP